MRRLLPNRFLPVLAACVAITLLGCDGGLDFDNASYPAPLIAVGPPQVPCASVGGGSITVELQDIVVTEGYPVRNPRNRLQVSGTVSGLAMDDSLELLLIPLNQACGILGSGQTTVDGSTFTAFVDFGDQVAFRAFLVAHAGTAVDLDCTTDSGCLSTAAGSFTAVSETIEVRLQ